MKNGLKLLYLPHIHHLSKQPSASQQAGGRLPKNRPDNSAVVFAGDHIT
jgi:hypothetical protein